MNWISSLFSRYWRKVHFGAILVVVFGLILNQPTVNGWFSQVSLAIFYYPFSWAKSQVTELTAVDTENRRLREALVEASMQLSRLEESQRENQRLRSILGFEPPVGYTLVPAQVLSVTSGRVPNAASINRGYSDSVFLNQPLINQDGLIGRISAISDHFSTVQLLTDPTNRVAVRIAESREMGIAKYVLGRGMILDNFPIQGTIKEGDRVLSSGLGGVYPSGLLVGTVKSVARPAEAAFCEVEIQPAANFNSLEELFLLKLQVMP